MSAGIQTFANVQVCLPSKIEDLDAEWQEVDWVSWANGELQVNSQDHPTDLVFRSADLKEATPLGGILKATNLGGDGCTLAVTTVGGKNDTYRIQFASAEDAQAVLDGMEASFAKLAASIAPRRAPESDKKKADKPSASSSASSAKPVAARAAASAPPSGAASSAASAGAAAASAASAASAALAADFEEVDTAANTEAQSKLEASINLKVHSGSQGTGAPFPLIYTGAQIRPKTTVGGDGSSTEEVFLSGAAVLMDPPDDGSLGKWQFMFFGEESTQGASGEKPMMNYLILPGTTLTKSDSSSSSQPAGAAVTLSLAGLGPDPEQTPEFILSFSKAKVAALFARDFRVRQRLMDMAFRNMQNQQEAMQLRREIRILSGSPFLSRVLWWSLVVLFLLSVVCVSRLGAHFKERAVTL